MEEMEKRSRRRARDLVTQAASQGLSENEIGCARISMMARSTNAPCKGRIQMRKTNPLHFFTFGLQRTAGPYSWVNRVTFTVRRRLPVFPELRTSSDRPSICLNGANDRSRNVDSFQPRRPYRSPMILPVAGLMKCRDEHAGHSTAS
jgi:hypothetical protein